MLGLNFMMGDYHHNFMKILFISNKMVCKKSDHRTRAEYVLLPILENL